MRGFLFLSLLLAAMPGRALETGVDVLLEEVNPELLRPAEKGQTAPLVEAKGLKLSDPFSIQLFSRWQSSPNLSYEVSNWVMKALRGEHAATAHLWTAMQSKVPDSFLPEARSLYVYSLWKLGLTQTFVGEYLKGLANSSLAQSPTFQALEATFSPGFDAWLAQTNPIYLPDWGAILDKTPADRNFAVLSLKAYGTMQKGEAAKVYLEKLAPEHALKLPLGMTVLLSQVQKKNLKDAGRTLKGQIEPALELATDPEVVSLMYLQIARLLYQAGALEKSESLYQRIPSGSRHFLDSREELAWVWLRMGKTEKLRGLLQTLNSNLMGDRYSPESAVVLAVSNLKLCYYQKVAENLKNFADKNTGFAGEIEKNIASNEPAAGPFPSLATKRKKATLDLLANESAALERLWTDSIQASLPAVGPQLHWTEAKADIQSATELAKKDLSRDYHQQWLSAKTELNEGIRKLRFVKVELLSQARKYRERLAANGARTADASAAARTDAGEIARAPQSYPFDGVIWPDEIFSLQALAEMRCPGGK